MQIFEQEKKDGLANELAKSCSIAFELIPTKPAHDYTDELKIAFAGLPNLENIVRKIDLFYFESVLASVGWNKNDDIFDPLELWTARASPVNKKINYMHNETDIIGHMTKALVYDHNGKQVLDVTDDKNIPTNFDVVVGGFLYTFWEDKALLERMQQIIDSISQRNIAVSMECIFPGFDYGIITSDGQHKIIARAEQTSFLTKHLRRYGGTGSYEGNKVGRLLRKMVFTGNAIVNKPANPRSLILRSEASNFLGSKANINILNTSEKNIMELTNDKYEDLLKRATAADAAKDALSKTEDEYKKAAKAAKDMGDECDKMKDEDKKTKASLTSAQESLKKVSDELAVAKEVSKANEDKLTAATAKITELETQLNEAKASIAKAEADQKLVTRKTALAEREIEEAKASDILTKFANVNDELFNEVVSAFPKKAVATTTTNKDILANAQMTTATASVMSDSQKTLRQNVSAWFGTTLQSDKNK